MIALEKEFFSIATLFVCMASCVLCIPNVVNHSLLYRAEEGRHSMT